MARCARGTSDSFSVAVAAASATSARDIADSLAAQLPPAGLSALVVFFSPDYDADELARELARAYAGVPVHGCSTAGEMTPKGLEDGTVVALGFPSRDFTIVAEPILNLAAFRFEQAPQVTENLRSRLSERVREASGSVFGLLLIDGMSRREEAVISALHATLDDIPVVGGSAGDGLDFRRTFIIHDGKAYTDAAILLLVHTTLPFRVFKSDHFEPTSVKMVVTEADTDRRIVRELNAEPAAWEYARVAGIPDSHLDASSFASYPVVVRVGGEYYARSIQRVNEDGSLSFFCAIDEGLILTAARRRDMLQSVRELFTAVEGEIGEVDLYLGFDCVLRRLDAEQRQVTRDLSELYRRHRVIGFSTYGEQFRSMHLNQTFTGVAIGRRQELS